jgi:hypothetical protein
MGSQCENLPALAKIFRRSGGGQLVGCRVDYFRPGVDVWRIFPTLAKNNLNNLFDASFLKFLLFRSLDRKNLISRSHFSYFEFIFIVCGFRKK